MVLIKPVGNMNDFFHLNCSPGALAYLSHERLGVTARRVDDIN